MREARRGRTCRPGRWRRFRDARAYAGVLAHGNAHGAVDARGDALGYGRQEVLVAEVALPDIAEERETSLQGSEHPQVASEPALHTPRPGRGAQTWRRGLRGRPDGGLGRRAESPLDEDAELRGVGAAVRANDRAAAQLLERAGKVVARGRVARGTVIGEGEQRAAGCAGVERVGSGPVEAPFLGPSRAEAPDR